MDDDVKVPKPPSKTTAKTQPTSNPPKKQRSSKPRRHTPHSLLHWTPAHEAVGIYWSPWGKDKTCLQCRLRNNVSCDWANRYNNVSNYRISTHQHCCTPCERRGDASVCVEQVWFSRYKFDNDTWVEMYPDDEDRNARKREEVWWEESVNMHMGDVEGKKRIEEKARPILQERETRKNWVLPCPEMPPGKGGWKRSVRPAAPEEGTTERIWWEICREKQKRYDRGEDAPLLEWMRVQEEESKRKRREKWRDEQEAKLTRKEREKRVRRRREEKEKKERVEREEKEREEWFGDKFEGGWVRMKGRWLRWSHGVVDER